MKEKLFKKGITRRLFSVVLALAMVLSMMPMNSMTIYAAGGSGSGSDPIWIKYEIVLEDGPTRYEYEMWYTEGVKEFISVPDVLLICQVPGCSDPGRLENPYWGGGWTSEKTCPHLTTTDPTAGAGGIVWNMFDEPSSKRRLWYLDGVTYDTDGRDVHITCGVPGCANPGSFDYENFEWVQAKECPHIVTTNPIHGTGDASEWTQPTGVECWYYDEWLECAAMYIKTSGWPGCEWICGVHEEGPLNVQHTGNTCDYCGYGKSGGPTDETCDRGQRYLPEGPCTNLIKTYMDANECDWTCLDHGDGIIVLHDGSDCEYCGWGTVYEPPCLCENIVQ